MAGKAHCEKQVTICIALSAQTKDQSPARFLSYNVVEVERPKRKLVFMEPALLASYVSTITHLASKPPGRHLAAA